jgi:hypothetical protein
MLYTETGEKVQRGRRGLSARCDLKTRQKGVTFVAAVYLKNSNWRMKVNTASSFSFSNHITGFEKNKRNFCAGKVALQRSPGQSQNIGIGIRTDTGKFSIQHSSSLTPTPIIVWSFSDRHRQRRYQGTAQVRTPSTVRRDCAGGRKAVSSFGSSPKSKEILDALEWSRWWDKGDAHRRNPGTSLRDPCEVP